MTKDEIQLINAELAILEQFKEIDQSVGCCGISNISEELEPSGVRIAWGLKMPTMLPGSYAIVKQVDEWQLLHLNSKNRVQKIEVKNVAGLGEHWSTLDNIEDDDDLSDFLNDTKYDKTKQF